MNRASLQRAAIAIALVLVCAALLAWRTLAPQLSVPQPAFVPVPEKATRESAAPVEPARAEHQPCDVQNVRPRVGP